MKDFLLAAGGFLVVVSLILWLEYRSRPRDPRSAGLRSANKDKGARR